MNATLLQFHETPSLAEQIRAKVAAINAAQKINHVIPMIEAGALLNRAKREECGNSDNRFNQYLTENEIELNRNDRAACMNLDRYPDAAAVALRDFGHSTSPEWVWRQVKHAVSEASETGPETDESPPVSENPAPTITDEPIPAPPSEPENAIASTDEPKQPAMKVAKKNLALQRWGEELAGELWRWFTQPDTRTTLNMLAAKRHGKEAAEFVLEQLKLSGRNPPIKTVISKATARLALPWLASPLADKYDLLTVRGLASLKEDVALIIESCEPVMREMRGFDHSNRCAHALRQAQTQRKVAAVREQQAALANPKNLPPIVVHGETLWPDGHAIESERLTYDEALWAFCQWREFDCALGDQDVRNRASFWRQRMRGFHTVDDSKVPRLALITRFWLRCAHAMDRNPTAASGVNPSTPKSRAGL